ncbi:MAG TPA: helix-turn-helix transcriptional regulator [Pirellulales bacterium]|jgi:transcriptional regulator with XRE-family HTH domain|nr:helix-turn-helix transcriptional regulator [Pirellulales bacterium]
MEKSIHTPEYAALRIELKAAREKAGLSQRDLAQSLDVPHSWVAKVETGERRIDFVEFCWFLSACGVAPEDVSERLIRRIQRSRKENSGRGRHSK